MVEATIIDWVSLTPAIVAAIVSIVLGFISGKYAIKKQREQYGFSEKVDDATASEKLATATLSMVSIVERLNTIILVQSERIEELKGIREELQVICDTQSKTIEGQKLKIEKLSKRILALEKINKDSPLTKS